MTTTFGWGTDQRVRGVNLGGWLVLEPWITPSLFQSKPSWVVDEITYGIYHYQTNITQGYSEIYQHWDNWITQGDMNAIAQLGLNTVRIPIGFWSIIPISSDEPFLVGALEYLHKAVEWARQVGLYVVLDLHGVPSGQNGFDNSGERGKLGFFKNSTSINRSLTALSTLASQFNQYGSTISSIQLINEAFPQDSIDQQALKQYYIDGYRAVREVVQEPVVGIGEAFEGLGQWYRFMPAGEYSRVMLDVHIYAMFSFVSVEKGYAQHLSSYCSWQQPLGISNENIWTIVGEFSPAPTDCALWLNGRDTGSRYDGSYDPNNRPALTGSCKGKTGQVSSFSNDYITFLAQSFETQTWVYETYGSGWIFWTWKNEMSDDWSFQSLVNYNIIPQPITAKPHGLPCNGSALFVQSSLGVESVLRPCLLLVCLIILCMTVR